MFVTHYCAEYPAFQTLDQAHYWKINETIIWYFQEVSITAVWLDYFHTPALELFPPKTRTFNLLVSQTSLFLENNGNRWKQENSSPLKIIEKKKIETIQKRERKKQTLERRMVIVDQGDKLVMKVKENDI